MAERTALAVAASLMVLKVTTWPVVNAWTAVTR